MAAAIGGRGAEREESRVSGGCENATVSCHTRGKPAEAGAPGAHAKSYRTLPYLTESGGIRGVRRTVDGGEGPEFLNRLAGNRIYCVEVGF